jgi:hypothetical protein
VDAANDVIKSVRQGRGRWWGALVGGLLGALVAAMLAVLGIAPPASAAASFPSSRVADLAVGHVGQHGGDCWAFTQSMIQAAGGPNISAQAGGNDYFAHLRNAGGQPIGQSQLSRGDVVQQGRYGGHTFIIVGRVSGTTFTVVDSNHDWHGTVMTYPRTVALGADLQAFRFGTTQQPGPIHQPVFPVMNTSEQPPDGVWFRDNPNLAGPQINGLGVYAGDRVALKCYGTGPAMGPYANHVWYQVSNQTRPTAPGRPSNSGWLNAHFINDGLTSNQIDPSVPVC